MAATLMSIFVESQIASHAVCIFHCSQLNIGVVNPHVARLSL